MKLLFGMSEQNSAKAYSSRKHYGVWGYDGMTDDEFVKELKAMRSFKHEDIEL